MAVNPPVEIPESGKAADIAEPAVVAEAGVTTSEWKLALGYLAQLAASYTAEAALKVAHISVDPSLASALGNFEVIGAIVAASYIVSRGIRKFGVK